MTRVVNIRLDPFDEYIGRKGRGKEGCWGNPFAPFDRSEKSVAECLFNYRTYLVHRLDTDPAFRERFLLLKGKRLGCFCAPLGGLDGALPWKCHGQIMAAILDGDEINMLIGETT